MRVEFPRLKTSPTTGRAQHDNLTKIEVPQEGFARFLAFVRGVSAAEAGEQTFGVSLQPLPHGAFSLVGFWDEFRSGSAGRRRSVTICEVPAADLPAGLDRSVDPTLVALEEQPPGRFTIEIIL